MGILTPSLPSFKCLLPGVGIDALIGYTYGKFTSVNPMLSTLIFVTRTLAETIIYHIARFVLKGKDIEAQKIFIGTSAVVNLTFILVLRELNLAAKFFPFLIGVAAIGQLVNRVRYIQQEEAAQKSHTRLA